MGLGFSKSRNKQNKQNEQCRNIKDVLHFPEKIEEMENLTLKNTLKFNFENEVHLCKVLSCYDGDTIRVAFKHNGKYIQHPIRMEGYDTPEIRTKDEEEKKKAIEARDVLREKILGKYVYVKFGKFCKYGRILGTVYLNEQDFGNRSKSINKYMEQYGKLI